MGDNLGPNGFAMAIAGGVFLSVVLAFFFTPAMFALLYAKGTKRSEIIDMAESPQPATLVRLASAT